MTERVGHDLLRALGSGVTPNGRSESRDAAASTDFQSLFDRARTGEIRSGLTVTAHPDLGLELASEQTELLSRIADLAQAQGIDRVLVTDGEAAFILDVESRTLTERAPAGGGELVTGIRAAVTIDSPFVFDDPSSAGSALLLNKLSRIGPAAG